MVYLPRLSLVLCRDRFLAGRDKLSLVQKTETGRDGIQDNAKLNSQLKIVKKSLDNATKAPKIEISVPIFLAF